MQSKTIHQITIDFSDARLIADALLAFGLTPEGVSKYDREKIADLGFSFQVGIETIRSAPETGVQWALVPGVDGVEDDGFDLERGITAGSEEPDPPFEIGVQDHDAWTGEEAL